MLNAQVDVINPSSELRDSFAKLKINYPRKLVFTKPHPTLPLRSKTFNIYNSSLLVIIFQNEYWPSDKIYWTWKVWIDFVEAPVLLEISDSVQSGNYNKVWDTLSNLKWHDHKKGETFWGHSVVTSQARVGFVTHFSLQLGQNFRLSWKLWSDSEMNHGFVPVQRAWRFRTCNFTFQLFARCKYNIWNLIRLNSRTLSPLRGQIRARVKGRGNVTRNLKFNLEGYSGSRV